MDYKSTLNLPQTQFPMKANLPQREPQTLAKWEQDKIYERILAARQDAPLFVLHDGPAVGDVVGERGQPGLRQCSGRLAAQLMAMNGCP